MSQIAAAGSGILSKLGGLKSILGHLPHFLTKYFVIFIFLSRVSQGLKESNTISEFMISVGAAFVKPLVLADDLLFKTISAWQSNYSFLEIINGYLIIMGALSIITLLFYWAILAVKSIFPEGMNSNIAIYGTAFFILFLMMTTYYSLTTGKINFGWSGVMLLFTNFSVVFQPIIAIAERFLGIVNNVPDGVSVPVFK